MQRCLLLSNRLPLTFNGTKHEFTASSGGLVSAIKGLDASKIGHEFEWMGLVTDDVNLERIDELKKTSFNNLLCHPIIVPKETYNFYYNDFCNDVLWPLFHYEHSIIQSNDRGWKSYQKINEIVANAIIHHAGQNDVIWIHDFHFFLVPGLIKSQRPDLKVGFFLHIPFPSSEIFRELPQRKEILLSVIESDLIGFHDLSYLTHFKSSLTRILGVNNNFLDDQKTGIYPISIDTHHFQSLAHEKATNAFITRYAQTKKDIKWVLGIDRLDYIKGLILKLKSFDEFLTTFPEWIGLVQMVQVVIPSRTDVQEYRKLKSKIEQMVSSINGKFGSPDYMPVHYLYKTINENELSALYQLANVMYVGSQRDGMNLVSLEYVVSQQDNNPGTLLLSEFTGAHSTLSYAISINPWDVVETAKRIKEALEQSLDKRRKEMISMRDFLKHYTSSEWAKIFIHDLNREHLHPAKVQSVSHDGQFPWMRKLKGKKVLFFCDLDGTLAPIAPLPSLVSIQKETKQILKELSRNHNLQFVVVSGRDKEFMQEQFIDNKLNFPLAACHGAYSYSPETSEWVNLIPYDSTQWKEKVLEIFSLYTARTPGSFVEDKGYAVTWHFRNSPPDFAEFLANKLFIELEESLTSLPALVTKGKKVIEVKSLHASKGFFIQQWLKKQEYQPEIILALGDDNTDEDMFDFIQKNSESASFCIKVGEEITKANYFIKDQNSVNTLLKNLVRSL
jgi:trehalose 6-phosphate synthase/phosphatase